MESLTDLRWIHSLWGESYLIQLPRYLFPHTLRHTATMLSKYLRIFSNISQFLTQICFWGEILSDTTSKYLFSHTSHCHNIFKLFKNILKYLEVIDQIIWEEKLNTTSRYFPHSAHCHRVFNRWYCLKYLTKCFSSYI